MRLIWKNNSWRIFLLHGTLILLCAMFPKLTGLEPLTALRSLFCGYPLKRVELKAGFLLMASILQCHNWLILSYMVKSESWLLPRYGSRKGYINAARRMLLLSNFIVVLVVEMATWIVICIQSGAVTLPPIELLEICGRGLLECLILSLAQLTFLLFMGEERTAMFMLAGVVALMLLSSYPLSIAWIAPVKLTTNDIALSTTVCVVVIVAVLRVQTYLYCKRGAPYYGAMY